MFRGKRWIKEDWLFGPMVVKSGKHDEGKAISNMLAASSRFNGDYPSANRVFRTCKKGY